MTSGAEFGSIGGRRRHVFLMLWGALSVFYVINTTVNAISQTTELTRARVHFDPIEPYVWSTRARSSPSRWFPSSRGC